MLDFVNLHCHTNIGSPYDALGTPKEWVSAAMLLGMDSMAITEHGNMNSLADFVLAVQAINKEGGSFKPIYGVEFYFIKDVNDRIEAKRALDNDKLTDKEIVANRKTLKRRYHLVVWATNPVGLKNLYRLVSESHKEPYFYYKPCIDFNLLKKYSEGLAGSSACVYGPIGGLYTYQVLSCGMKEQDAFVNINNVNKYFKSVFNGNWFNEIQWNALPQQTVQNLIVIQSARMNNIPLISTVDSHFIKKQDWKSREFYFAMKYMRGNEDEEREYEFPETSDVLLHDLSLKNGDLVWASYKNYSQKMNQTYDDGLVRESITNTRSVQEMIEPFYPDQSIRMPSFIMEQYKNEPIEEIRNICYTKMKELGRHEKIYIDRLEHELKLIQHRGFEKYFLTMREIVSEARKIMGLGVARGSAAGALTSYLLEITQVDPIKFDLSFARFLTYDVNGYPDIDFDCADPLALKEHLIQKWGKEKLAFVSNWNLLSFKTLVKDLSRFFGIPFQEANDMTKIAYEETWRALVAENLNLEKTHIITLEEILKHSFAAKQYFDRYPHLLEHIKILSGQVRDVSTHAGGIIIGDNLKEELPLISKNGKYQTPWPEGQARRLLEPMGFVKYDVLGVSTIDMIMKTLEKVLIKQGKPHLFENVVNFYNEKLHPDKIIFEDQKVYDNIFGQGNFVGVFQFSQDGMQDLARKFKPKTLIDLAVVTSIYRPGPLSAGVDKMYLEARSGRSKFENFGSSVFSEVTKSTNGFIIFQEQISSLFSAMVPEISDDEGQKVRKLLTKKKGGDLEKLQPYKEKLFDACLSVGMATKKIEDMWDMIVGYSSYLFNKSHAVSYSMITYQCAYLNTYCPREWVSSVLDVEFPLKKNEIVKEVKRSGYKVSTIKYGISRESWYIDENNIVYPPYWVLKGVSKDVAEVIMNEKIENIFDLYILSKTNKKAFRKNVIKVLIQCGVFDHLFVNKKINKKGMLDFLDKNKKQIYSLPHFEEVLEFYCRGILEFSDLDVGIALKENTEIFYERYFYPKSVVEDCVKNGILPASRLGRYVEPGEYIIYIDSITNFSGAFKVEIIDEYGEYKNLFSKDRQLQFVKPGNLYFVDLVRKNKTNYFNSIKNVSEFML